MRKLLSLSVSSALVALLSASAWGQVVPSQTGPIVLGLPSGSTGAPTAIGAGALLSTFDVTAYGAKCDGATDDTTAINNAFSAARTAYGTTYHGVKITFPASTICRVNSPLNFTGFTNTANLAIIDGQGATIESGASSGTILDAMGSQHITIRDLQLVAYTGTQTSGIQIGRTAGTGSNSGGNGAVL